MLFVNIPTFSTAIGFEIGMRDARHFENLSEKISHVDLKKHTTDCYAYYNLLGPAKKFIIGKAYTTYTIERIERLSRNYLASFARKTYCQ